MANNICNCPNPPGGQVVCEPHQMAVCYIEGGVVRHQCLDPIKRPDSLSLVNWALSEITGNVRSLNSIITYRDIQVLTRKKFESSNTIVTFSLPPKIQRALEDITRDQGGNDQEMGNVVLV